ncbi:MAG: glycosyltransferase [Collinsella sp.]|uniref:glycosyltransferase family 2 protein n=1 Tax=Collinsella sp. TaxID=1965294 RepID=UPI002E7A519E|nr:glycosyltransferase [Collinsella sp.]MEE0704136.1 glycosyltransferase [Collinsella sp.]
MDVNTTIAAASVVQDILWAVGAFFLVYLIGYATFQFLSVATGASVLYRRRREARYHNRTELDCHVPVSIVVPAHNESVTIVSSVRSLLALDYSLYEVVVVDDGSSDDTSERLIEAFGLHAIDRPIRRQVPCRDAEAVYFGRAGRVPITLVRKVNGGKADALNMGINAAQYPYFICIDADSVLQRDSLTEIVAPVIEDDSVVAVGGLVRPSNGISFKEGRIGRYSLPCKVIPAMQVLEYDRSFLSARILFDQFNGNLIISGAFGLFRKDLVIAAGGYGVDTVGEDMEIVTRLHVFCCVNGIDYKIRYAPDAICWSQAPESLGDLVRQRRRWHRGLLECMVKHSGMLLNSRFGLVGMVSYTYFLIYELLSPIIEVVGITVTAVAALFGFISVPFMLTFLAVYALFGAVMSLTAFISRVQTRDLTITPLDVLRALYLSLLEVTVLRFVMSFARMSALLGYRGRNVGWESLTRSKIEVE